MLPALRVRGHRAREHHPGALNRCSLPGKVIVEIGPPPAAPPPHARAPASSTPRCSSNMDQHLAAPGVAQDAEVVTQSHLAWEQHRQPQRVSSPQPVPEARGRLGGQLGKIQDEKREANGPRGLGRRGELRSRSLPRSPRDCLAGSKKHYSATVCAVCVAARLPLVQFHASTAVPCTKALHIRKNGRVGARSAPSAHAPVPWG